MRRSFKRYTGFTSPAFTAPTPIACYREKRAVGEMIASSVRSRHAAGVTGEGLRIAGRRLVKDCFSMRAAVPNVWLSRCTSDPLQNSLYPWDQYVDWYRNVVL